MGALRWTALLLAGLLLGRGCSGSSVHSLRFFYTAVSESGPGLPRFVAVGYVDGQLANYYDSNTRKTKPRGVWMEMMNEDYWDQQTNVIQGSEAVVRGNLATLRGRYNQSAGLHTLQRMYGCDLNEDAPSGGYDQHAYEGRDFLAFDKETRTWTAPDAAAQITKRKLEAEPALAHQLKNYLEETCIDWLKRYLDYGKETLLRKEPPVVKVTRKDSQDGLETLLCQAHGFYPREIDITWRKDGVVRQEDTLHGFVSPNDDGTYYTWLSIDINPQERSHYQCHVEHDGLSPYLDVAVDRFVPVWVTALGVVSAVVVLVLVATGIIYAIKKRSEKQDPAYKQTSTSDQGSDSSARDSPPLRV